MEVGAEEARRGGQVGPKRTFQKPKRTESYIGDGQSSDYSPDTPIAAEPVEDSQTPDITKDATSSPKPVEDAQSSDVTADPAIVAELDEVEHVNFKCPALLEDTHARGCMTPRLTRYHATGCICQLESTSMVEAIGALLTWSEAHFSADGAPGTYVTVSAAMQKGARLLSICSYMTSMKNYSDASHRAFN